MICDEKEKKKKGKRKGKAEYLYFVKTVHVSRLIGRRILTWLVPVPRWGANWQHSRERRKGPRLDEISLNRCEIEALGPPTSKTVLLFKQHARYDPAYCHSQFTIVGR